MLIIAQPKSASTSLMVTLAKILKVGFSPVGTNKNRSEKFKILASCYRNMRVRPKLFFKQLIDGEKVFKDHTLPLEEHIEYIKEIGKPVILLLRKPGDCFDCHIRLFDANNNQKTDRKELKKDIKKYYDDWSKVDDDIFLKIYYKDLVIDYYNTMKKILDHLGQPEIIPLEKRRYTGVGEKRLKEKELDNVISGAAEECIDEPIEDDSTNIKD
jgi:hypothetical protein